VLRHFRLEGSALHDDKDARTLTVLTDDERPVVFYGEQGAKDAPAQQPTEPDKADAQ
jgi:manganese/iron transport system ATP-binding protein